MAVVNMFKSSASNVKHSKQTKKLNYVILSWWAHTYDNDKYITPIMLVMKSASGKLEVECLWHHLPPIHELLFLFLLPLFQRLQLKIQLRVRKMRRQNRILDIMRRVREQRVCVYPCSRAVGNSYFLDHSEVPRSRCWHFVVTRSQQAPVIAILS